MNRPLSLPSLLAAFAAVLVLAVSGRTQDQPVSLSLESPTEAVEAGTTVTLPLRFDIERPWHVYAPDSPGDMIIRTAVSIADDHPTLSVVATRFPDDASKELVVDYGTGEVERFLVLEGLFTVEVDVAVAANASGRVEGELLVDSQACDDFSCLPPQYAEPVAFVLDVVPGENAGGGGDEATAQIEDGPVLVDVSVERELRAGSTVELELRFEIEEPYHVYTHDSDGGPMLDPIRTAVSVGASIDGVEVGEPRFPQGKGKDLTVDYGSLGSETYQVWSGGFDVVVPVTLPPDARGELTFDVDVEFQACDEVCYPPVYETVTLTTHVVEGDGAVAITPRDASETPTGADVETVATPPSSDLAAGDDIESRLMSALGSGDLGAVIGLSILAALFALLTPCVFPMIPITVSFFTKRAEASGGRGATKYALAYGGGIVATYTGFGLLLALVSAGAAASFATNPWVNLAVATLFVFFGLSLLGFYDLKPPAFLTKMAEGTGEVTTSTGYLPVMAMGFVFTVTAFTCTAPVVGTLLAGFSTTDSPTLVVVGMLAFSTTFALPFVLLAMFPTAMSSLPSAGGWMLTVKAAMGYVELVAALKFLSNADIVWGLELMPRPTMLLAAIILMTMLALYLLGTYKLPHDYDAPKLSLKGGRGVAALATVALVLWLASAMTGKPLSGALESYLPPADYGVPVSEQGAKSLVPWRSDLDEALDAARAAGKPVFVDFTGVTCVNCRIVEKKVFESADFAALGDDVVFAKLYTDRRTAEHRDADEANKDLMSERFGTVTLPLYALVEPTADGGFEILRRMSMPKPDAIRIETFRDFVDTAN